MTGNLKDVPGIIGVLVPLAAIVMGIGLAFWSLYLEHQRKRLQYQERQLMIEKGMTPSPWLPDEKKHVTPQGALHRGIVMVCLGIGLMVATIVVTNYGRRQAWFFATGASVVGFLGIGNLLYYAVSRKFAVKGQDADTRV